MRTGRGRRARNPFQGDVHLHVKTDIIISFGAKTDQDPKPKPHWAHIGAGGFEASCIRMDCRIDCKQMDRKLTRSSPIGSFFRQDVGWPAVAVCRISSSRPGTCTHTMPACSSFDCPRLAVMKVSGSLSPM